MSEHLNVDKLQIPITGIVTILILSLLLWEHFHGGVPSHYILQREDLPEISNWWGLVLLPVLTWTSFDRIRKRTKILAPQSKNLIENVKIIRLFIIGLLVGLALAISFTYRFETFLSNIFYVFLILGLIVPLFYCEFILGFVLGMTYTLGAVLPTLFVLIIATVGLFLFKLIRPLLLSFLKSS